MTETIEPMAAHIDQQRLAEDLVEQARAEGVNLVGTGGLLTRVDQERGRGGPPLGRTLQYDHLDRRVWSHPITQHAVKSGPQRRLPHRRQRREAFSYLPGWCDGGRRSSTVKRAFASCFANPVGPIHFVGDCLDGFEDGAQRRVVTDARADVAPAHCESLVEDYHAWCLDGVAGDPLRRNPARIARL